MKYATEQEVSIVAAAMWNDGHEQDGRPPWSELDHRQDAAIIREMTQQARAGLAVFTTLRT